MAKQLGPPPEYTAMIERRDYARLYATSKSECSEIIRWYHVISGLVDLCDDDAVRALYLEHMWKMHGHVAMIKQKLRDASGFMLETMTKEEFAQLQARRQRKRSRLCMASC